MQPFIRQKGNLNGMQQERTTVLCGQVWNIRKLIIHVRELKAKQIFRAYTRLRYESSLRKEGIACEIVVSKQEYINLCVDGLRLLWR